MKKSLYLAALLVASFGAMTSCQDSYENVSDDNKIWDPSDARISLTLLDGKADVVTKKLNVNMAAPVDYEVKVTYGVTPEKLEEYKAIYGGEPELLPEENYNFDENKATIFPGGVTSSDASITFSGILSLDDSKIYVLPVSIVDTPVPALFSRNTTYFVFQGAALINTVANMTGTCLRFVNEGQTPMLGNLRKLTFEALIRPDAFTNQLSTLMGIEGDWLIRIGDAGVPSNQIQLASGRNVTDPAWQLETGKWTFVTLTFDGDTGEVNVYFNGVKKGETKKSRSETVDWNVASEDRACYIGYSYDTNRDFMGDMSEVRVWNRVLTPADLAERNHFYSVRPDAEGLVLYLKFDEGAGNYIHDYANGYDMYVPATFPGQKSKPADIKWNAVTLPE